MGISPEELALRQEFIGASDAGIILGLSPWKTRVDLWVDKTYGSKFKGNSATARGNRWEPRVIEEAAEYLNREIAADVRFERHIEHRGVVVKFAANCDGVVQQGGLPLASDRFMFGDYVPEAVVEAKTARSVDGWGTPGTDEIPDTYMVQTLVQMWCSGAVVAWVPVLCGFDFYMFKVVRPPEDDLLKLIRLCCDFWVDHVVAGVRPEGPSPSVPILASIERKEDSAVEMCQEHARLVPLWLKAKIDRAHFADKEDGLKRTLIESLGDNELGLCEGGYLSYFANARGARTLKWNEERWTPGSGKS